MKIKSTKSAVKSSPRQPRRILAASIVALVALNLVPSSSQAGTTWDGGAGTGNWDGANNWNPDGVPAPSDALTFSGAVQTITTNNLMTAVGGITFDATANAFTLGGSAITLSNGITNNSALGTQTISFGTTGVTLGNAQSWNAASGALSVSSNVALGSNLLTINGAQNTTISGVVSGTAGVTKSGAGTLVLSGANTYDGTTTISGGTLTVQGGAAIEDGRAVTVTSGTFDVDAAESIGALNTTVTTGIVNLDATLTVTGGGTVAGLVQGGGGLTVNGGTLGLSASNTYGGVTTITGGGIMSVSTLANGGANSGIGASSNGAANLVLDGGTLRYTGAAASTDRLFTLGTGASAGTIESSGTGALNFTNTGVIAFTGAGARTLTLGGNFAGVNTMAAQINDGPGGVTTVNATGGTTIWLLTNNSNSFGGLTTVNSGQTLQVGANGALGGGGNAGNGTTVNSGGALQLHNGVNIANEFLFLNGSGVNPATGALALQPGAGNSATWGGPITIQTNATITANGGTLNLNGAINKNATTLTFGTATAGGGIINANAAITGAAANSDVIVESVTVNYNAANAFNGPTFIRSSGAVGTGILNTNVAGAMPVPVRTAVTMDDTTSLGGSQLNLNNGFGQAIASLASPNSAIGQSSQVNLNGNTLTIGNANAADTQTFFGRIGQGGPIDNGGLIKDGASTQVLAGNNNNYIGNTLVQAGRLQIGNGTSGNIHGASAVTVNPLAFLDLNLANGATFANNVLNNGTVQGINTAGNTQTVSGVITGIGNFAQTGGGRTIFTNVNTYQGGTGIIGAGSTLQLGTAGQGGTAGSGIITMSGGTLALVNVAGGVLTNHIDAPSASTVLSTTAASITLSGNLTDAGAPNSLVVTHSGTGNLILTGANTYSGATTVTNGELHVGSNGALGGTGTGTTVNGTGTLRLLNGVTIAGEALSIAGTGTANKGALANALGGTSAYGGAITLAANASINANGGTMFLTGGVNKNGFNLTLTGGGLGGVVTINTAGISGAADLIVDGVMVNANVANSYVGPTFIINGGVLNANVANALPTAGGRTAVSIDASGTGNSKLVLGANQSALSLAGANTTSSINLNSFTLTIGDAVAGTTSFSGVISGAGGIAKDGASTQTLAGTNTYTGATTVTTGTLQAGSTSAFGVNSAVTVNGGFLDLAGNNNAIGSLAGAAAGTVQSTGAAATLTTGGDNTSTTFIGVLQNGTGTLGLTKVGTGTQTLTGANTYTGATTVNGGTLQVGNGATGSLAAASIVTVNNTGTLGVNLVNGGTFGNNVFLSAGGVINGNNSAGNGQTFSGVLQGAGGLSQSGTGTTVLIGANTFSGATTVTAGVLQVGNGATGSLSGLSAVTVSPAAFLDVNLLTGTTFANTVLNNGTIRSINAGGTTQTFSGAISGAGSFVQNFGGTGILTNNNSYAGGTTIAAISTLQIGTAVLAGSAGTGAISVSGGGTLALVNANGNVLSNNIINNVGGTGTVLSTAAGTINLTGNLTDGGAGTLVVTQSGTGILILSGANSYVGATTVNSGELQAGTNTALGGTGTGTTVNAGGTLRLLNGVAIGSEALSLNGFGTGNIGALAVGPGGTASYAGAITLAGNASINTAGGVLNLTGGVNKNGNFLTLTGGGTVNISAVGISGVADLVVDGVVLNQNVANSYVGPTWITNGGILNAAVANALPTVAGRTAVNFDPALAIPGSPAAFPSTGNSKLILGANQSALSLAGANTTSSINLNTFVLTVGDAGGGTTSFSGVISGAGGITKDAIGTQILAGANNYTGATNVTGGTLQAGSTSAFGVNSAVTVGAVGTLDMGGFNNTIGSLTGAAGAIVRNSTATAATLTTGTDNTSTTYAGAIQDGAGAALGLTKNGTGTQTLTGTNTYSGITTIHGGILEIGNGGLTGTLGTGNVVNNSVLAFNRSNALAVPNIISGTGIVNQNGTGVTTLSGLNTYTGQTNVNAGTLQLANVSALGNSVAGTVVASGATLDLNGLAIGTEAVSIAGTGVGGAGALTNTNAAASSLAGTLTLTAAASVGGTAGNISLNGPVTGAGLTKVGTNTVFLTNNGNNYTTTTISAGTLQVGNGGTSGVLGGGLVTNNATLNFNRTDTLDVSNVITGSGVVNQNGTGTTNLSGPNSYTGLTTVNAGVLEVQNNTALGTAAAGTTVVSGATLRIADGINTGLEALTLNGTGTGAANALGALTVTAGGTATVGGPIAVASNSTIHANGGTLNLNGAINKTDVNLTLAGGGTINVNGSITGNAVGFNDDLIVNGTTSNLNAANSYLGQTIITSVVVAGDGIVNANVANALPTAVGRSAVIMDNAGVGGSTLNIGGSTGFPLGASQSIASLVGTPTSNVTLGANKLTIGFGTGINTNGTANANFAGVISGTGSITKDDTSTQILSGLNTYTGETRVTGGTLRAGSTQAFGVDSATFVGTGAVLDLAGNSNSIGSLSDIGGVGGTVRSTVGAATLTTGGDNTSTSYAGLIQNGTGPLTLVKTGTGTQSLSGNNTYSGDTFLNEGGLFANVAPGATTNSAFGTGTLHIAGGTTLGSTVGNETISNNINVNGDFSVSPVGNGASRLNLAGNVNVGFGNRITNVAGTGEVQMTGVTSGGSVTFAATGASGSFVLGDRHNLANPQNGSANTFFGPMTIESGAGVVLAKNNGVTALPGDATVNAGGTLVLFSGNQISDFSSITVNSNGGTAVGSNFGGFSLNGNNEKIGSLFGTGTVQLDNTPTGGASAGVLTVDSGNFSGTIFDNNLGGQLVKQSGGTLVLTGHNTFVGNTNVLDGTLHLNGSLRSANLIVHPIGTLQGFGQTSGNVVMGGTFRPGTTEGTVPGTFTIGGNYTQNATGTLVIDIAGTHPSLHDRVVVGGTANLDGSLRLVRVGGAKLKVGDKITFLTASGGVNGEFANVNNDFEIFDSILTADVIYRSNTVSLEIQQGSFGDFAKENCATPNSIAVGQALDRLVRNSKNHKIINFLNAESLSDLCRDFDLIAPEEFQAIYSIGISQANVQTANIARRLDDIRMGSVGFSSAGLNYSGKEGKEYSGRDPLYSASYLLPNGGMAGPRGKQGKEIKEMRPPTENRSGVFFTGFGEFSNLGSTQNASGYNLSAAGFTLGMDYRVNENFAIGVNLGYSRSNADLFGSGNVNVDGFKMGLYATYHNNGFYVDGSLQGGYNTYDTRRTSLRGTATGSTDGTDFNALLGFGYDTRRGALTFGPLASLQYTRVGFDSFRENGSLSPLNIDSQSAESLRSALGFKASYEFRAGTVVVRPEARVAWQHEFGDTAYGVQSSFANGGNTGFTVHGAEIGRDSMLLGAGLAVLWNERTSTYVYYDGELFRDNFDSNNVSGGVRVEF